MQRLEDGFLWLFDGGFGLIVYSALALILGVACIANAFTAGLFDTLTWVYGFLAWGAAMAAFGNFD